MARSSVFDFTSCNPCNPCGMPLLTLLWVQENSEPINPVLRQLHWISISFPFSTRPYCLLTRHSMDLVSNIFKNCSSTKKSDQVFALQLHCLIFPGREKWPTYGNRAFHSIGRTWWNCSPALRYRLHHLWTHSRWILNSTSSYRLMVNLHAASMTP